MFCFKVGNGLLTIKKSAVVVVIFDIFTVAYAIASWHLSSVSLMVPRFLFAGIAIFSLMCFKQDIHYVKDAAEDKSDGGEAGHQGLGLSAKLCAFLALSLLTLLFFDTIGAVLSIPLFLIITMLILDVRNIPLLILLPIIMDAFVLAVFKWWLAVPLPAGIFTLF